MIHAAFLIRSSLSLDGYASLIDLIPDDFTRIEARLEPETVDFDVCPGTVVKYRRADLPELRIHRDKDQAAPYDHADQIELFCRCFRPERIEFDEAGLQLPRNQGDGVTLPIIKKAVALYVSCGYRGSISAWLGDMYEDRVEGFLQVTFLIGGILWEESNSQAVIFHGRHLKEGEGAFVDHFLRVGKALPDRLEKWQSTMPVA